ncbi:multicopper oxidase family protein [Castellaniella sp.]|uniref:multicopper oxidase family protein n=1 Tax=Castellaniella sp. TaxID=1955812 RepID=UPI002AFE342B|nr:multicopper oxidase domain-containing protein [Castellaniella sp.]
MNQSQQPDAADPKRRDILRWTVGLSAGLVLAPLAGCDGGSDDSFSATVDTLPEAPRIVAKNGLIDIDLEAAYAHNSVQLAASAQNAYPGESTQQATDLRSYNGAMLAPTLQLNAGDTLRVLLHNKLPGNNTKYSSLPYLNYQNSTNLHFHGLHVNPGIIRPGVYGDYVVDTPDAGVVPGASRQHEIHLPADHTNGVYWYHPHLHGSTTTQVANGMFGAILVNTPRNDFDLPDDVRDRVIFVHRLNLSDGGRSDNLYDYVNNKNSAFMLNGVYQPTIVMRPGEIQNWHFLNSDVFYPFNPVLDEHTLWQYARDGNSFDRVFRPVNAATSVQMDGRHWPGNVLYPGNRSSVLVQASQTPGTYYLRAAKAPSSTGEEIVARIVVEGRPVEAALPSPHRLPLYNAHQPITDAELAQHGGKTRAVILAMLNKDSDLLVQPIPAGEEWFIPPGDGVSLTDTVFATGNVGTKLAPFQSDLAVTQTIALNAVEEWTLYNLNGYPHPFHIHVNDCYVVKVNGEDIEPYWADTIPLAPNGTSDQPTSITFRSRFTDFTGKFVWHCHALDHEDLGMMELVEVRT